MQNSKVDESNAFELIVYKNDQARAKFVLKTEDLYNKKGELLVKPIKNQKQNNNCDIYAGKPFLEKHNITWNY